MLEPTQVLNRYYPEVRAWLIQIAAVMDRFDRACAAADNGSAADPRLELYQQALKVLQSRGRPDRAERIQMIFSDPYEAKK